MFQAVGTRVTCLTRVVSPAWKSIAGRFLKLELAAIGSCQFIYKGVELEGASNGHCDDEVGRGDEGVGGRVGVVAASEVTYVKSCQSCVRESEIVQLDLRLYDEMIELA